MPLMQVGPRNGLWSELRQMVRLGQQGWAWSRGPGSWRSGWRSP